MTNWPSDRAGADRCRPTKPKPLPPSGTGTVTWGLFIYTSRALYLTRPSMAGEVALIIVEPRDGKDSGVDAKPFYYFPGVGPGENIGGG